MAPPKASVNSVDDIIVAPEQSAQRRDPVAETDAFMALSQTLAQKPDAAIQRLVETAMKLVDAESAGVSLEDTEGGQPVFRWIATAGEFAKYVGETMPRDFSPCGTVVERNRTLVMRDPVRYFPYASQLEPGVRSVLLVPFARKGQPVGTVWVSSHAPDRVFSEDDVRVVQTLTTFATTILDAAAGRHADKSRAR